MELLLIRHGLPLRVQLADGPADPDLAPEGQAQAVALAEYLSTRVADGPIAALYTSPLARAFQTAKPLAELLGLEVHVREGLKEYDAHSSSYVPLEQLADEPEGLKAVANDFFKAMRGGFKDTVVKEMDAIARAHSEARVAVVCHGGVINAFLSHVLGVKPPINFAPAYTSVTRVGTDMFGTLGMLSANEMAHL